MLAVPEKPNRDDLGLTVLPYRRKPDDRFIPQLSLD